MTDKKAGKKSRRKRHHNRHKAKFRMNFGPGFKADMGGKFAKAFVPLAGLALAGALSGCNVNYNVGDGVPLDELDIDGATPTEVILASGDIVEIKDGKALKIKLKGSEEAKEQMRFELDGDALTISREDNDWKGKDPVTVKITMPTPSKLNLLGSGSIKAASIAGDSEIVVAGSGTIDTPNVAAGKLEVNIMGSGTYAAAGTADSLELNVMGSGAGSMDKLKAGKADVSVMGSGSSSFASDGDVEGSIMGSGSITVKGGARCSVSTMGSGKLVCERADSDSDTKDEAA